MTNGYRRNGGRRSNTGNQYTEEEQKQAVAILAQYGGGVTAEAIAAVQRRFPGVARSTVFLWWNKWHDEVVPKALEIIVEDPKAVEAYQSTDEMMFKTLNKALLRASSDEAMSKASAKDAALVAAIMIDKLMLRVGISPELLSAVKKLIVVIARKGFDPLTAIEDMIESFEEEPDKK